MKKKILAAALIAAMLAPMSAQAAEWIQLSSWSYAEVSGFISDGLLPESMKGISDYKRVINRGEFCELVYSMLYKTGRYATANFREYFSDCENYPSVDRLCSDLDMDLNSDIKQPEYKYSENIEKMQFMPELPATRAWAAGLIKEVLRTTLMEFYRPTDEEKSLMRASYADFNQIEQFDGVMFVLHKGIMSDTGDGYFHGEVEMTIEQAVSVVYRTYKELSRVVVSDNESGKTVREIGAGLTEEITKDYYYVKSGDNRLLALETDVYSMLMAADYNGKKLVFAVNFNDKTDVFDTADGSLLYTVPYIVNELDAEKGYAYTISGRFMPYYSGIYGMDNREIMPPEYSRMELNKLMAGKKNEYSTPDGLIYYADWNDGGNMYRRDTNGENEALIVEGHDCTSIDYLNGKLYFNEAADRSLYTVDTDGNNLAVMSKNKSYLQYGSRVGMYPYKRSDSYFRNERYGFYEIYGGNWWSDDYYDYNAYTDIYSDGSILYCEYFDKAMTRTAGTANGNSREEKEDGKRLYKYTADGKSISIADFYISEPIAAMNGDGKIYFMNEEEIYTKGESPIYVHDENGLRCVSGDYKAACFGFLYDTDTDKLDTAKLAFMTQEDILLSCYHILDLASGEVSQAELAEEKEYRYYDEDGRYYYENIGNDEVKIFHLKEENAEDRAYPTGDACLCIEYNGEVQRISNDCYPRLLSGDYLYYSSSGNGGAWGGLNLRRATGIEFIQYNYKTGEKTVLCDDFADDLYFGSEYIAYVTPLGEVKVIDGSHKPVTAYPCKGIFTYGQTLTLAHMPLMLGQKTSLYKLNKDGIISRLTEHDTQRIIYVPNDGDVCKIW